MHQNLIGMLAWTNRTTFSGPTVGRWKGPSTEEILLLFLHVLCSSPKRLFFWTYHIYYNNIPPLHLSYLLTAKASLFQCSWISVVVQRSVSTSPGIVITTDILVKLARSTQFNILSSCPLSQYPPPYPHHVQSPPSE